MKVGELAAATGLTVRTLHHWEERGLVVPSARTHSGHRVYDDGDVRRVYQVVALRELGLPLDAIGELLVSGAFGAVLAAHLEQVDTRLAALQSLRRTLAGVVERLRHTPDPAPSDVLRLMDEVSRVNETFAQYFTPEQVAELQERRTDGEATAAEWPGLIEAVRAEMDAGTDPSEPRVQALAARWAELLAAFHRGDPELGERLNRMRTENAAEVSAAGGPDQAMIDYIGRTGKVG
ncbi:MULTISPECIES: MerR family transcriptional regulator [Pseudonocardia]|uniref:HTH-type transcriptional activator TipA n=2 Tax=Pseudonocardia TaxID=1847 RepID=A0A1Y2N8A7_PSEAH|nr:MULTISPECIES: MerR family transcriptional regulator [Pseudonocardia]OSY43715.1 HTH-type transcriptional activator TipA [Pseudonocardia autotrophica]TDN73296.1 DNA-binding transcriptional MerR regulator [Pseudonocardia autotrophica]BBG04032.1 MerR family transcriptional regulator [Pseudonocardia autotrophica]GEC29407.1 MerR family transcriptional regulator [Pseudonocardia saturnea]